MGKGHQQAWHWKISVDTVIAQITGGFERHSAFNPWRFDQDDKDAINQLSTCGCNQNVQLTNQNKQHVDSINPKIERVIEQKYSFHMDFSNQNQKSPANMGI